MYGTNVPGRGAAEHWTDTVPIFGVFAPIASLAAVKSTQGPDVERVLPGFIFHTNFMSFDSFPTTLSKSLLRQYLVLGATMWSKVMAIKKEEKHTGQPEEPSQSGFEICLAVQ